VKDETQVTSVRTDSSASQGRAEESVNDVRLLFAAKTTIKLGDIVAVLFPGQPPMRVEIMSVRRMPDVSGVIHHIQVEGVKWESG